jgi:hypothetical protein
MGVREEGTTLDETWRVADLAMYRHKRRRVQDRVAAALAGVEPPRGKPSLEIIAGQG